MDNFNNMPTPPINLQQQNNSNSLLDFSILYGQNEKNIIQQQPSEIITVEATENEQKRKYSRKNNNSELSVQQSTSVVPSQKNQVETIVYADSYNDTNTLLNSTIAQTDILATEIKMELDKLRSSNQIKNKYTHMSNLTSSICGLLGTKVQAIKELNNSIKVSNDSEYRRYKDNKAGEQVDDNKYIMDMYSAYVKTPQGAIPNFTQSIPNISDMTNVGDSGIIRANPTSEVLQDSRFNAYMSNLTPEQNLIMNEDNPNIEEVIIYDYASGKKYFDWIDKRTNQHVPNLPVQDSMFLEDYSINPKTMIATNTNIKRSLRVVPINQNGIMEY